MDEKTPEVTSTFKYTFDDYKKTFISAYYANKRDLLLLVLVIPIMLIGTILYVIFNETVPIISYEDTIFLVLIGAVSIIFIIRPYTLTTVLRRKCLTTYQYNQTAHIVVINGTKFYWKNAYQEYNINWNYIHKVVEQREAFCFYLNTLEYRV
ncbi:MAG: hypothetical protein ACTSPK_07580, partial [Candidatus Heimdallarchaeota archaeon]